MASGTSFIDELFRSHVVPENVKFSVFTPDELRSIGVVKIRSSNTADPLGHPIPYGLYDKRMGPLSFSSEPCGTCNQNLKFCPGHFGYVEFPLPVVNPFFHKIIGRILRVSCLSCGQIDQPEYLKRSFVIEMKLLDRGLLTEALELHVKINDMSSSYGTTTSNEVPEDLSIFLKEYEDLCNKKSGKRKREFKTNKNIEQLRNQFIDDFFQPTTRKICLFCRGLKDKLQVLKNKIIIKSKRVDMSDSLDKFSSKGRSSHTQELKFMTPKLSRDYLRQIWKNDKECLQYVLSAIKKVKNMEHPTDCFYFNIFLIAPPCFRPTNMVNGRLNDHPLTKSYKGLIESNMLVYTAISALNQGENSLQEEAKVPYSTIQGSTPAEKLNSSWDLLQISVNGLMDKELCRGATYGLKQFIEKKEGLIRQNMMGKRVNFSARSVITPDPNLSVDEIGIPEEFAKTLTYPVPVTPWNVAELQKLVMNGPKKHPGAYLLQKEKGNAVQISATDTAQRKGLMKSLLTPDDVERNFNGVKIVHRHLQNGDIVLVNRQPTLHKPSIMAHKVRILKGEKTLRLHYANCKSYNADFDGDEMNIHFPQSELARSESYNLVNVGNQYLVPKDGTPLSGLIQDHIIAAVQLSVRGRFFTRADYYQLVYQALAYKPMHIKTLDPAIIKPRVMWSGKQIISTVLINVLPGDRALINLTTTSKIKARTWETDKYRSWKAGGTPIPKDSDLMSEAEVIIRQGELLSGILDKAHLGSTPFGMIHCINELYGGNYAVTLLSCFSRLLTGFQQIVQGFTLGVEDILVRERADRKRRKVIEALRETDTGKSIITEVLGLSADTPEEEIVKEIQIQSVKDPKLPAAIDRAYKKALDSYTKDINEICVPNGLISKFPHNNLQLMVQSGAKGSSVNTNQISALLGQIELEGKRPPKMINGKSLPCFPATEFSPRSGGFIDGRFMTGIKPQEMFFHCMAGREGLIDTAVKTSRSGYLQRCLVKHLEGLTVGYDMTVRDSDGTLVQTQYGEDGMDILKVQFLNKKMANFMAENSNVILNASVLKSLKDDHLKTDIHDYRKKIKEWKDHNDKRPWISRESPFTLFCREVYNSNEKNGNGVISKEKLLRSWSKMDDTLRYRFEEKCRPCPDPVSSVFLPGSHFGVINERLEDLINNTNLSSEEKIGKDGNKNLKKTFKDVIRLKAMQALCSPGEAVGLLAAQSIGEPSTQMTLNTFHFAGRGDMNVTLGIPRLREILMMASKNLKTPAMEIPFLDVPNLAERAEQLRKKLNRVVLFDILEKIEGSIQLDLRPNRQNTYEVKLFIHPYEIYKSEYCVKQKQVLNVIRKKFFSMLHHTMTKRMSLKSLRIVDEGKTTLGPKGANKNVSDDENEENQKEEAGKEDSSDEEPEDSEDAKMAMKYQQAHEDQDPEDEEWQPSEPEDGNEENDETKNSDIESRDECNEHVRYSLDQKHYRWFKITFGMLLQHPRICNFDLLLKEIAERCVIWETPNIKKAITYDNKGVLTLRTDGINIEEMSQYYDLLDLKKLHCNDVHKMAETYGIDAAKQVIVKEVRDVFEAYSITVDPRHLSLVADYMTSGGTFEPLSRKGMESGASPLQQISFEASGVFLKEAAQRGKKDRLTSPTGSIMVGGLCKAGTGACAILNDNLKMSSVC